MLNISDGCTDRQLFSSKEESGMTALIIAPEKRNESNFKYEDNLICREESDKCMYS